MSFLYIVEFRSEIPHDCIYQCIVFDMNTFLKNNPVCENIFKKILHQETIAFTIFQMSIHRFLTVFLFCLMPCMKKDTGYELTVFRTILPLFWFSVIITLSKILPERAETINVFFQFKQVPWNLSEKITANPITLQRTVCFCLYVTEIFLQIFFSEMTHQTPVDYLNRQRIEEACFQLAATDDSITEIAYRNGFNDLSYFIRTFKNIRA